MRKTTRAKTKNPINNSATPNATPEAPGNPTTDKTAAIRRSAIIQPKMPMEVVFLFAEKLVIFFSTGKSLLTKIFKNWLLTFSDPGEELIYQCVASYAENKYRQNCSPNKLFSTKI